MSDAGAKEAKPAAKSKKMVIIIAAAALVLGGGGAGAWFFLKKGGDAEEEVAHKVDPHAVPTYLPLDPMVVNLADPAGDRYAQVGITLEISDPKAVDQVKAYMPTIRNGILMVVSQKTMYELLMTEGKEKLAKEILVEVSKPLGFDDEAEAEPPAKADKKKKKKPVRHNPIERVLFSSFIVQ